MSRGLSNRESAFFGSATTRQMNRVYDSYLAREDITPAHFEAAEDFFYGLRECFKRSVLCHDVGEIKTEGGLIMPDSHRRHFSIHASQAVDRKKGDYNFESAFVFINKDLLHFYVRPFPVTWRMEHIENRYKQRSKELISYDHDVFKALSLYYLMQQVIEGETDWHKTKEVPVAVPLGEGLCLGLVEPRESYLMGQRLARYAEKEDSGDLEELLVLSKTSMNLYTYIGAAEMTPQQKRIHEILSGHLKDEYSDALSYAIDRYRAVREFEPELVSRVWGSDAPDVCQKIQDDLSRFIQSKLWRGTVRSPKMIKTAGGAIVPR